ncbi:hypothetical protein COCOBI_03-3130 [Coccomyxa sp. Obi]|nr:hypothetical protein COCOBI_03-3130 [Coccomyxa sp. Obi]
MLSPRTALVPRPRQRLPQAGGRSPNASPRASRKRQPEPSTAPWTAQPAGSGTGASLFGSGRHACYRGSLPSHTTPALLAAPSRMVRPLQEHRTSTVAGGQPCFRGTLWVETLLQEACAACRSACAPAGRQCGGRYRGTLKVPATGGLCCLLVGGWKLGGHGTWMETGRACVYLRVPRREHRLREHLGQPVVASDPGAQMGPATGGAVPLLVGGNREGMRVSAYSEETGRAWGTGYGSTSGSLWWHLIQGRKWGLLQGEPYPCSNRTQLFLSLF